MKKILFVLILCSGCGGKLSDEQRKKLHEGMSTQDIKRVTEADLQEYALRYGQTVMQGIDQVDSHLIQKSRIDSLAQVYHVRIYSLMPSDAELLEIEKELVNAYVSGSETGQVNDNLQKVGSDSLLYTKPVFKTGPDGTLLFSHAIGVMMPRKFIILSMPQP